MKPLSFDITVPGECMGGCAICVAGTLDKQPNRQTAIPAKVWRSVAKILELKEYAGDPYTLSFSRISTIDWSSLMPLTHLSPRAVHIAVGMGETDAYDSMVAFLASFFPQLQNVQLAVAQSAKNISGQIEELVPLTELAIKLLKTGRYRQIGVATGVNDVASEREIKDAKEMYRKLHIECHTALENTSQEDTTGSKLVNILKENKFGIIGVKPEEKGRQIKQHYKDEEGRIFSITTAVRTIPKGHKGVTKEEVLSDLRREKSEDSKRRQFMIVGNMINFHHSQEGILSRDPKYNASWTTIDMFHDKILPSAEKKGYLQARIDHVMQQ